MVARSAAPARPTDDIELSSLQARISAVSADRSARPPGDRRRFRRASSCCRHGASTRCGGSSNPSAKRTLGAAISIGLVFIFAVLAWEVASNSIAALFDSQDQDGKRPSAQRPDTHPASAAAQDTFHLSQPDGRVDLAVGNRRRYRTASRRRRRHRPRHRFRRAEAGAGRDHRRLHAGRGRAVGRRRGQCRRNRRSCRGYVDPLDPSTRSLRQRAYYSVQLGRHGHQHDQGFLLLPARHRRRLPAGHRPGNASLQGRSSRTCARNRRSPSIFSSRSMSSASISSPSSAIIIKARIKTRPIKQWVGRSRVQSTDEEAFRRTGDRDSRIPHRTIYIAIEKSEQSAAVAGAPRGQHASRSRVSEPDPPALVASRERRRRPAEAGASADRSAGRNGE